MSIIRKIPFRVLWIFWALQVIFGLLSLYWLECKAPPPPGYSIGMAAVVAAAMAIHPEMKAREKALWLVIIAVFVIAEFKAIRVEKADATSLLSATG